MHLDGHCKALQQLVGALPYGVQPHHLNTCTFAQGSVTMVRCACEPMEPCAGATAGRHGSAVGASVRMGAVARRQQEKNCGRRQTFPRAAHLLLGACADELHGGLGLLVGVHLPRPVVQVCELARVHLARSHSEAFTQRSGQVGKLVCYVFATFQGP
jgi:hypothetical protein